MSSSNHEPQETDPDEMPETLPMFPAEDEDDWSGDELEEAYQQAMSALDQLEDQLPGARDIFADEDSRDAPEEEVQSLNDFPGAAGLPSPEKPDDAEPAAAAPATPRLLPAQIIEAALFVGGMPLTVKRLAGVLRDEFDREFIERTIDELNLRYDDENRPYEIRLEEGGYRMLLRPEFETVRNKSYGFGPKEVRLSQDVLEVLALVAYRQPISRDEIEAAGKSKPNGALRQLLRREIIGLERTGKAAGDVRYHTTPRFLQIFGLSDLSELPKSEDLSFK